MATIELTASSIIAATGWTGATTTNLRLSDDTRATDGDPGELIHAELTDSTVDFDAQNSVILRVEARVVGTVSRDKQLTVELLDSGDNLLESFTTDILTASDVLYSSSTFTRSDSAAVIDGYRIRATVIEGNGMPDSAKVEIDQLRVTLDYNSLATLTDDFNRGANDSLGASWSESESAGQACRIGAAAPNQVELSSQFTGDIYGRALRSEATFPNDQFARLTFLGHVSFTFSGLIVRGAGAHTSITCYYMLVDTGGTPDVRICKYSAENFAAKAGLATLTYTATANDTFHFEAKGTALRVLINGIERLSTTDADIASGKPGMGGVSVPTGNGVGRWDNFFCTQNTGAGGLRSPLAGHGGLAGPGGLAGNRGGLAG